LYIKILLGINSVLLIKTNHYIDNEISNACYNKILFIFLMYAIQYVINLLIIYNRRM